MDNFVYLHDYTFLGIKIDISKKYAKVSMLKDDGQTKCFIEAVDVFDISEDLYYKEGYPRDDIFYILTSELKQENDIKVLEIILFNGANITLKAKEFIYQE